MRKGRLVVVILLAAGIVAAASIAYMISPSWLPQGTTLGISSPSSMVESGSSLEFTATVNSGKTEVVGGTITWSAIGGSLDRTTGSNVTFTAPAVNGSEPVTLTARFGGEGLYQPSTGTAQVMVVPARAKATSVLISPVMFEVHSGEALTLNAFLNPSDAPAQLISWSIDAPGSGQLSSATGPSVTYTAPVVQTNVSVTITASFPGYAHYLASEDSSQGTVVAAEVILRQPTYVVISPPNFSLQSTGAIVLTAGVFDSKGDALPGKAITWRLNPSGAGLLSSTTDASVNYTPPPVDVNTTVTITASFAGDEDYLGSRGSSTGAIEPAFALSDLYLMGFNAAVMTNLSFQGPLVVDGMTVTYVTCDLANMSGFTLSHFGMDSLTLDMVKMELYVTDFTAYSPDSNTTVVVTGADQVSLGPMASTDLTNGAVFIVRMSVASVDTSRMEATGESVGGSEPYIPSILSAQMATLGNVQSIIGPASYGDPAVKVSNISTGMVGISQFSLMHPSSYSLDRGLREYNSTAKWLLTASQAIGYNMSVCTIYFNAIVHGGYYVTASGDDDVAALIPHSIYVGRSFSMYRFEAHADYIYADELTWSNFTLSIE